jgi:monothiol glutaredoxin
MKGTRHAPRCGFSARVVDLLDTYLDAWTSVDILADADLREAIKEHTRWPTIPQIFVDGVFIGGADIAAELEQSGELAATLGSQGAITAPRVTLTPTAREALAGVLAGHDAALRVTVSSSFQYDLQFEAPRPGDVVVSSDGLRVALDRASARRADGMTIDFIAGDDGGGLLVNNPREPRAVQQASPAEVRAWLDEDDGLLLVDVRPPWERSMAAVPGAAGLETISLDELPRDTALAFLCHHGVRSQAAAEAALAMGFAHVFNVSGGIDAWSTSVDPSIPRY